MKALLSTAALLALTSLASAQTGSIAFNNATYQIVDFPTSATADAGRVRFTANAAAASSVAYSMGWYYRINGDVRESTFNNSGAQVTSSSFVNNVATIDWADVDGRGISATEIIHVISTGATSGTATHHMTVRNNTGGPITLSLFAYCDMDHCGTANGDSATGTTARHTVTDAACGAANAEFFGIAPAAYMVADYPVVLDALVDGAATTLPNTGLPFAGPADYTGAMQWNSGTLAPGASFKAVATLSHNFSYTDCGVTASTRNYGVPVSGAGGPITISTLCMPVVGNSGRIRIANAPLSGSGTLLLGENQLAGDAGVSIFGLTIYTAVNNAPITYSPTGTFELQLNLPLAPAMCGGKFHFQAFANDLTSPATLPLAHSNALEWTIGM